MSSVDSAKIEIWVKNLNFSFLFYKIKSF